MSEPKRESAPKPDDVLLRMLNTPPHPHVKKAKPKRKKRSKQAP